MFNRSISPKEVKTDIIALKTQLKQPAFNLMLFKDFLRFLTDERVTFDGARKDTKTNLKMIILCCHYVKNSHRNELLQLLKQLAEEDINIPLLVNVENALRKRFSDKEPTLINEIRAALVIVLGDSQYEKADIAKINEGVKNFIERTPSDERGFLLYTHIHRKKFLELESGKPKLYIDVKPAVSSSFNVLTRIASGSALTSSKSLELLSGGSLDLSALESESSASIPHSPVSGISSVRSTPSSPVLGIPSLGQSVPPVLISDSEISYPEQPSLGMRG